jgi:hypothetical protein
MRFIISISISTYTIRAHYSNQAKQDNIYPELALFTVSYSVSKRMKTAIPITSTFNQELPRTESLPELNISHLHVSYYIIYLRGLSYVDFSAQM